MDENSCFFTAQQLTSNSNTSTTTIPSVLPGASVETLRRIISQLTIGLEHTKYKYQTAILNEQQMKSHWNLVMEENKHLVNKLNSYMDYKDFKAALEQGEIEKLRGQELQQKIQDYNNLYIRYEELEHELQVLKQEQDLNEQTRNCYERELSTLHGEVAQLTVLQSANKRITDEHKILVSD